MHGDATISDHNLTFCQVRAPGARRKVPNDGPDQGMRTIWPALIWEPFVKMRASTSSVMSPFGAIWRAIPQIVSPGRATSVRGAGGTSAEGSVANAVVAKTTLKTANIDTAATVSRRRRKTATDGRAVPTERRSAEVVTIGARRVDVAARSGSMVWVKVLAMVVSVSVSLKVVGLVIRVMV